MVEEGSAQIGLILEVPADVRMRVHAALAQPIRLIVPNGHALAARASVDLATIARQRLILPAGNLRLAEILQSHFRDKEIPLSPVITSNLLQPIIDSVVAGLGLTMMPEVLVHRKLGEGVLAAVPIDCTDLSETGIMLITRPGHRLPAAGTLALTNLASAMAKLQPAD